MPSRPPNILMFVPHDLGRHLGCYGAGVATPNIDALAAGGVRFANHHCTAAQCSPSRGSIMTGKYPHRNGIAGQGMQVWPYNQGQQTLQMLLREAGYSTHLFGFQHETSGDPRELGYDAVESRAVLAPELARACSEWLGQRGAARSEKPFFACIGTSEPHRSYYREGYPVDDLDTVRIPEYLPDLPGIRADIAGLNGLVRVLDDAVGEILHALDRAGLSEDTLVIFTTDHGIAMPRAKGTCYDPGTETALIMRLPGRWEGGIVREELLTSCDLLPTLLEVAGSSSPGDVDGVSFAGLLDGGEYAPRDHIFTEMTFHGVYLPMRCIRTLRHKYIRNFAQMNLVTMPVDTLEGYAGAEMLHEYMRPGRPDEELYELGQDPLEMHNVAGAPTFAAVREELSGRLQEWMEQTEDLLLHGPWPAPKSFVDGMRQRFLHEERFRRWLPYYTHDEVSFMELDR